MTDWTTKVWGIDASDCTKANFGPALAAGLGFATGRIGQGLTPDPEWAGFVQQAHDQHVPVVGGYFVIDPVYYVEKLHDLNQLKDLDKFLPPEKDEQFQMLKAGISNKAIQFVSIDVELTQDYKGNVIDKQWNSEAAFQFITRCRAMFPALRFLVYTGKWFIDSFAPNMQIWMGNETELPWVAQYTKTGVKVINDWSKLAGYYPPPQINGHEGPDFLYSKGWRMWQWWGDGVASPDFLGSMGKPCSLDVDFFNGDMAALCAWAGVPVPSVVVPPAVVPPVVVPPVVVPPVVLSDHDLLVQIAAEIKAQLEKT